MTTTGNQKPRQFEEQYTNFNPVTMYTVQHNSLLNLENYKANDQSLKYLTDREKE